MPASFIIQLIPPAAENPLSAVNGRRLHGAFMAMVAGLDSELADRLHEQRRHRPFTLAPDLVKTSDSSGRGQNHFLGLRVTSLSDWWTDQLMRLADGGHFLEIGQSRLTVKNIVLSNGPQTGQESYKNIINHTVRSRKSPRKIKIFFNAPTAFRSGQHNLLFPLPSLVFSSLRDKWNTYSDHQLPVFSASRFDELLHPSRYKLRTNILSFRSYRQIGFTGYCEYQLSAGMVTMEQNTLLILTRYIFYAGIGYKTTMGMGQTRGILL